MPVDLKWDPINSVMHVRATTKAELDMAVAQLEHQKRRILDLIEGAEELLSAEPKDWPVPRFRLDAIQRIAQGRLTLRPMSHHSVNLMVSGPHHVLRAASSFPPSLFRK